jgi:hypothetical protein
MSDEFNPLKDIFSKEKLEKFQDSTINFFSTVIRENEKNIERVQSIFSKQEEDAPMPIKDHKVYYECPFPTPDNPFTPDDICHFPTNKTTDEKSKEETIEVTPMENSSSQNPTPSQEETSQPLTDKEVINKTASMWKYNPVASKLDPFPEYITQRGTSQYAEVLVSRVRGKKHKHDGSNCDDNFSFDFIGNCCIVALSDGAGSKKFSRLGSDEVTKQYVQSMKSSIDGLMRDASFWEGLSNPITDSLFNISCSRLALEMQNGVKSAYSALSCKFEEISQNNAYIRELGRDVNINDLACTLLTAIIIPIDTPNGVETFVATLQIGDGMVCSINEDNSFETCTKVLGSSDSGAFSGETDFITSSDMLEQSTLLRRIKISKCKTSAVVLATDGVADDYFPYENKSAMLYRDLQLNCIVPTASSDDDSSIKIVAPIREQKTIEETPKDICVAYSEDIKEFFNIDDATLWQDTSFVKNAVSVYGQSFSDDRSLNLQNWLDNYTKRGSFDDRTLFIYRTLH